MQQRLHHSADIRQAYLDYFKAQGHTIVPSSSLLPSSPNLLFTNSGMNQFVPYFLGERTPIHSRVADTQKCIRAGGKHNDLDDVGFDGYHHTFFEMLGNWSFGDYFKKEAIHWAWTLLTKVWGFPKERLYATVYKPNEGDPAEFDQDSFDLWKAIFIEEGMDPNIHICYGNKKDNFWMMGETGPCGPCTELHMDLTPEGNTKGQLVNQDSDFCIELWNLVFIQFNAEANGQFTPLPSKHVDTGMGFERIAGILASTQQFTDYSRPSSNYNSDLFTDIFKVISDLSGKEYQGTLPSTKDRSKLSIRESQDCTFRVLADHIRTLSFAIADGILPGNEGRNYVLRRILRRAVLFGKRLGLKPGFLVALVDPLVAKLGNVFQELKKQERIIKRVLQNEENAFERTLERGLQHLEQCFLENATTRSLSAHQVFTLYDTYGFPLDLSEIIAQERGFSLDKAGFELEMEKQRERARNAQQKTIIQLSDNKANKTEFVGYDRSSQNGFQSTALSLESIPSDTKTQHYLIADKTPFYAEMGGQIGDQGSVQIGNRRYKILNTTKDAQGRFLHLLEEAPQDFHPGCPLTFFIDIQRRRAIERHHSAVHILHWALRTVLGKHVAQAGSYVGPNSLRFDFSHFEALTEDELSQVEALIQERILEDAVVQCVEILYEEKPEDVLAFFGDKYAERVRVVDIGGFSKELCAGTHVQQTGEIGAFKITSESAISAGTRRIEAICGQAAFNQSASNAKLLSQLSKLLSCQQEDLHARLSQFIENTQLIEKKLRAFEQKELAVLAEQLLQQAQVRNGISWLITRVKIDKAEDLKSLTLQVSSRLGSSFVALGSLLGESASIAISASAEAIDAGYKAEDSIKKATALLSGKGGGRPDFAMGGGKDIHQLDKALASLQP